MLIPAPFRVRGFRFQFAADLAVSCAFEMEGLILAWFILVRTESVFLLSLFGALQSLGTLCAPFFGLWAERLGTRNMLALMRAAYVVCAGLLMMCAVTGWITAPVVFAIGTLMGLVRSSDIAMRNLMVSEQVPPEHLMTALSISRMTQDIARTAGALTGAGLFVALGIAPAYVAVTLFYVSGVALVLRMARPGPRDRAAARIGPVAAIREGMRHAWSSPVLLAPLLLAFLVNFTAYPLSGGLLAYVARDIYGLDQSGLGTLSASFALGGLGGSLALSTFGAGPMPGRVMLVASMIWHGLLVLFVHAQSLGAGIAALALAGFVQNFCMIPMSLLLLSNTEHHVRGRVMGLRMLAIYGLPLGLTLAGALTGRIGLAATGTLYCALGAVVTLAIGIRFRAAIWRRAER